MHQNIIGPLTAPILTMQFDQPQSGLNIRNSGRSMCAVRLFANNGFWLKNVSIGECLVDQGNFYTANHTPDFKMIEIRPLIDGNSVCIHIVTTSKEPSRLITEFPPEVYGIELDETNPKTKIKKIKNRPTLRMSGDEEPEDPISALLRPAPVLPVMTFVVPLAPCEAPEGLWNAWYSATGAGLAGLGYGYDEAGAIVEYTEINQGCVPKSKWQDLKYVGCVRIAHEKKKMPGLLDFVMPDDNLSLDYE